ncbi:MAG: hypothetical protein N2749_00125 [Clostridia bacterium]|nr:hypothetical protein [Clostridia bacterium]
MKKINLLAILLITVSFILFALAVTIAVISLKGNKANNNVSEKSETMYLVTEDSGKYGISKADGTILVRPECSTISRIQDTVYLKIGQNSYLYFLNNNKSLELGGKETDIIYAYSDKNELMPYFILKYGSDENNYIYRVYNVDGTRYTDKDYTDINTIYSQIKAQSVYQEKSIPENIKARYINVIKIPYLSKLNKYQYIVSRSENGVINYGIVDEDNTLILPIEYSKIDLLVQSKAAVKLQKDNKLYLFTRQEKSIEIEDGFEVLAFEDGYFIQKRGTTVNKVYDLNGKVIIDGIYNYPNDFIFLNSINSNAYILLTESQNKYSLYNIKDNSKIQFESVSVDYFKDYTGHYKNSGIIYIKNEISYILNLKNFESIKINVANTIYSVLDYGIEYISKQ